MKKYIKDDLVEVVRELGIKDKEGNWVQVEYKTGKLKGCRIPYTIEDLKDEPRKIHIL